MDQLAGDLELTEQKAQTSLDMHVEKGKLIQGLRDDFAVSQKQFAATKAALDKTTAEGITLRAEYEATKLDVDGIKKRLMDTVAHVDRLQYDHDNTNNTLAGVSFSLQETRDHVKNSVDVKLEHQANDLRNLDAAQQATAQLLAATKRFTDDVHEEFKMSQQRQDEVNSKREERLTRVDTRMGHFSTMLTETINRLNTFANHLRSTNAAIR